MALILGKNGTLAFSRPKRGGFLLPVSAIYPDQKRIAFSSQSWYSGDKVWIIHKSIDYRVSIIRGYLFNNKPESYARIHSTSEGAFSDREDTVIDLSEITVGPFALLPECNSVQLGVIYSCIDSILIDIESTQPISSNVLLEQKYQEASLIKEKEYGFQAYTTGWSLNLESPSIDTHSLGERFKTVSKDVLSGSGSVRFVVDFAAEQNQLGAENYIELMSIFSDEPDATAKLYLNDVKNKALANRDTTGSRIDGDLYYETDVLFTDITFEAAAESKIEGSITFVSTGPIRLKTDVNALEDVPGQRLDIATIPFAWTVFINRTGDGGELYGGYSGITSDPDGNVYYTNRVKLLEGYDAQIFVKCSVSGEVLFVKYLKGEIGTDVKMAVNSDGLIVYVFSRTGGYYGGDIRMLLFRPDGTYYKETRAFIGTTWNTFAGIGKISINPVTKHIYVSVHNNLYTTHHRILVFDAEGNYIRLINPEPHRTYGWNNLDLKGITYDEDGNVTFVHYGFSDTDYISTGNRYHYGAAYRTTADGIFIHKIVYYGDLATGGTNWAPTMGFQSQNGDYIITGVPNMKLNKNLVPVMAKTGNISAFLNTSAIVDPSYSNGNEITFGTSVTIDASTMTILRNKSTFYEDNYATLLARDYALDPFRNRILLASESNSIHSMGRVYGITSFCDLRTMDYYRSPSGKHMNIKGSDSSTTWGYIAKTPYDMPDAPLIPYTQTTRTTDTIAFSDVFVINKDETDIPSLVEVETTTNYAFDFGRTPQLDAPRFQLFKFEYTVSLSGIPYPKGKLYYTAPGPYGYAILRFAQYDLDGKECWNFFGSLEIGTILAIRDGNNNFSPFTIQSITPNANYLTLASWNALTGFPRIAGNRIYIAVYNGQYDPTYLQHELR